MQPIQPPTDNLYKFVAIGGIALIIAGVFLPLQSVSALSARIILHERELGVIAGEEAFMNAKADNLNFALDRTSKKIERLEKSDQDSPAIRAEVKDLQSEVDRLQHESFDTNERRAKLTSELRGRKTSLKLEGEYYGHALITGVLAGLLLVLVGTIMTYKGFRLWYFRLQIYQDAITKREAEKK